LPPDRLRTLVDGGGRFHKFWKPFIAACLVGRVSLFEVERELTAQVWRLMEDGVHLTHLDSHKHVHAYPPIFNVVAHVAARFGIPVVRVPSERGWSFDGDLRDRRTIRYQSFLNLSTWPWNRRNYKIAAALGLRTPDFAGRILTGVLTMSALKQTVRKVRPGVTELMVHPGNVDDELLRTKTRLLESRRQEVDLLCHVGVRQLLLDENICLGRHDVIREERRSETNVD
jgi:predicted glycoside hydrolase/deacetylase ChbG (UPF0249 family)